MKKGIAGLAVLIVICVLCACTKENTTDYTSWLPDNYSSTAEQPVQGKDYQLRQETITDTNSATTAYSAESLVELLLNDRSEDLADKLWQSQIANGVYSVTQDELNQNMITYYVSSSEGDDNNLGLSPKEPKKTLGQFSGRSNITVLLKCGDTFEIEDSFAAGNGCIYATYGQGSRPILSFYKKLTVPFEKLSEYNDVWVADLLEVEGIYNGREDKDNCNIGQLVIDGEVNWKRVVVSTAAYETFDFPADIAARADGSWTVDWLQSKLYLYSKENPNEMEIFMAPDVHGIDIDGCKNTVLKGWTITGAGAHGCNIKNGSNVTVQSCFFYNIGGSVHRSAGIRYGNAVQVWDSGINISISYNYADWVFDSCYTNQGSSQTSYCENVIFEKNIGAHSFTGIESWADSYSETPFHNLVYRDNILYRMCDITDPEQNLFADKKGGLLLTDEEKTEYVTYRGGYTYNQMACMNIANSSEQDGLVLENNICWMPRRLLLLCSSSEYPEMHNNVFYAEVPSSSAYMFRYQDMAGNNVYSRFFSTSSDLVRVFVGNGEAYGDDSKKHLIETMDKIVN